MNIKKSTRFLLNLLVNYTLCTGEKLQLKADVLYGDRVGEIHMLDQLSSLLQSRKLIELGGARM